MHPVKFVWAMRALIYKLFLCKVGNLTYIGKPLFIEGRKNITIGSRTRIFPGIRLEAIGSGEIQIGNNVAIEQNVQINSKGSRLCISDNVTIAGNVFISNLDHEYTDIYKSVMDQNHILKETRIGEGCFIGFGAIILPGTRLGRHCIVGSNAVLKGEYGDYSVILGIPGRAVKRYNCQKKLWEKV